MPRTNDLTSVILGSSRSSFVNTICKFVRDVDEMNETVMIPSMLTDINNSSSSSSSSSSSAEMPECFDLQTLHKLLNRLKDELTIARFEDDQSKSCNFTSANNILSINNCNNNININNNNNNNRNVQINVTTSSTSTTTNTTTGSPLRIAEGDLTGLSKKMSSSCKCSDSDDGFSSLNSYSRNSDDESTSSSPSSDSDSECCSSSSSTSSSSTQMNQSRENEPSIAESSPEYIVNLLRLHIQGIQSILTRFSKSADQISESYINSIN